MSVGQSEHVVGRDPSETRYEDGRARQREYRTSAKVVAGAFSMEAVAATATVVLAILGLVNVYTNYMLPIAVITTAAAMLFRGSGVASSFRSIAREAGGTSGAMAELGAGISAEMLAGAAGLALGVLALLEIAPLILVSAAVVVFGGALLLGGGQTYRVSEFDEPGTHYDIAAGRHREATSQYVARLSAISAAGAESLVGIAAIVLGILALSNIEPTILSLVGLLSLGGAMLLSGATVGTRLLMLLR